MCIHYVNHFRTLHQVTEWLVVFEGREYDFCSYQTLSFKKHLHQATHYEESCLSHHQVENMLDDHRKEARKSPGREESHRSPDHVETRQHFHHAAIKAICSGPSGSAEMRRWARFLDV
jgi:hypothetical protein